MQALTLHKKYMSIGVCVASYFNTNYFFAYLLVSYGWSS